MQKQDLLVKCVMCGRFYFKPKEDVGKFPIYNLSKCDECKQVKLNTERKGK